MKLFVDPFDKLLSAVEKKRQALLANEIPRQTYKLPADLAVNVQASLEDWRLNGKVRRLWARDATLWTGSDEASWLGWLGITDDQLAHLEHLRDIAKDVQEAGFSHALLLGMGGSSLGPEVLKMTFGNHPGFPEIHVLDSTVDVCLLYGLPPCRHLTGEAHGLTVRLYNILDMWRIAASHGGHDWNAGTTTGGQDIGIALPESF